MKVGPFIIAVLSCIGMTMPKNPTPESLQAAMLLKAPPPPIGPCCF